MTPRVRAVSVVVLGLTLAWASLAVDARRRNARRTPREAACDVTALVGNPDLALSSSARWLRHPSTVEPWAAVADLPASLDVEPAGALLAPPTDLFDATARDARRQP